MLFPFPLVLSSKSRCSFFPFSLSTASLTRRHSRLATRFGLEELAALALADLKTKLTDDPAGYKKAGSLLSLSPTTLPHVSLIFSTSLALKQLLSPFTAIARTIQKSELSFTISSARSITTTVCAAHFALMSRRIIRRSYSENY